MAGGNYSARITERGGGIVIVDYNCKVGEGEKETLVEKEGSERRLRTQWRIFCNVDDVGTISVMPPGRERKCDKQPAPTRIPANSRKLVVKEVSGKKFHLWAERRDVNCRLGLYTSTFLERGGRGYYKSCLYTHLTLPNKDLV